MRPCIVTRNIITNCMSGIKVESTMKAGGLVSDDLILRLIRNELSRRGWLLSSTPKSNFMTLCSTATDTTDTASSGDDAGLATFLSSPPTITNPTWTTNTSASFLLDGFPRTEAQATSLDDIVPINLVVSLKTPVDVVIERISGRWVHEPSGRVYNTGFNAPKVPGRDDVTGEPLVRRMDDDEKVYRERFRKFSETSKPLLDHYDNKGVLWEVEGMSSDEITPKLFAEFERRFC
jgi:adenylate kinase